MTQPIDKDLLFIVLQNKPVNELRTMKQSLNRAMASGKSPTGSMHEDYAILQQLMHLIREKEAEQASQPPTLEAEAEKLAREHHVSIKTAQRFLERRNQERDPLDTARKNRLPAPDPEPAEAPRKQRQEAPDLRPYRMRSE